MKRPRLKGKDWAWGDFNPKTEMKMGKLRQDFGAETVWKNRSHTRSGLVSFFQTVSAREIDADCLF